MEVFNSIHFLRPWWFLALLPIAWLIWRAWQANAKQGAWHKVIDPKFRTLLLGEDNSNEPSVNQKMGYLGITIAWVFAVLALSGPWVKSIELPAQKAQQGVVIVLDLSLSMLADDLSPNRLSRVKYKLTDLLKQHPEFATGMVAYAGSAHTISPISEDNRTLLNLLPSLNPVMMPKYGANPLLGFEKASELFKGANINQGHILWITDDIEKQEVETITDWVSSHAYSMTVMTVGTDAGGVVQIPNYGLLKDEDDKLIMPKLPLQRFQQLSQNSDIKWIPLIPGEGNVKDLLPPKLAVTDDSTSQDDNHREKDVKHPLDIGAYFLFFIIPLVALIFRKGTLLALTLVVLTPTALLTPQPSYAKDWITELPSLSSMFKSPDQQGYDAWKEKKYEAAGAHFENPQWRASALYRQGKYAEAAKMFNLDKSPIGHYNRGNALALSGSLQGAQEAYEKALQLNPDFKDAKANLAIINNLLAQQPPENKPKNQQKQSDEDQNSSENQKGQTQNQANNAGNEQEKSSNPSSSNIDDNSDANSDDNSETNPNQAQNDKTENGANASHNAGDSNDSTQPAQNASKNANTSPNSQEMGNKNSHNQTGNANDLDKPALAEGESSQNDKNQQNPSDKTSEMSPSKLDDGSSQSAQSNQYKTTGEGSKPKLSEEEQANQNWLKQIPDQPGLFLKRKFEYQFQQNPRQDQAPDKQW